MAVATIGSGGGRDFSTVQAWIDSLAGTLTEPEIGELYADSEFVVTDAPIANFTGITTSADNYIELRPATGQGFADHADVLTNGLRYNASNGVALRCTHTTSHAVMIGINHVRLRGLQIQHDGSSTSERSVVENNQASATGVLVDSCIIEKVAGAGAAVYLRSGSVQNCLVIQRGTGTNARGFTHSTAGTGNASVLNTTVVRPSNVTVSADAFNASTAALVVITNVTAFGFTNVLNDTSRFTASHVATDLASVGTGSNHQTSLTYADQFEEPSAVSSVHDFRHKTGNDLDGNGTASGTPTLDIIGRTRPNPPAIGAWDAAAPPPAAALYSSLMWVE